MTEENEAVAEQEPQAEEVVQEEPPKAPQDNPLFKTLFEAGEEGAEEEEQEVTEEPEDIPMTLNEAMEELDSEPEVEQEEEEAEQEPAEPQEEALQVEKGTPKKKKLRKVVDPEVPEAYAPKNEYNFEEEEEEEEEDLGFLPAEKEVYDLAKYASRNMAEHKGLDKKFKTFFEKSKSFLDNKIKDDPSFDPEDDYEYKEFMEKNRPEVSPAELKKIEKSMWIQQAKEEAKRELMPEQEKIRKEMERSKKAPRVQQAKAAFRSMAQNIIIPEEVNKRFSEGGQDAIEEFRKENPLEFQIMERATGDLLSASDTLTDILMNNVDLDMSNEVHKGLLDWVNEEQENYIKSGQTEQDGRMFMRRERYFQIPEDKRSAYYTWSDDDLLKILALRSKERVAAELAQQREILEKSGYVKASNSVPQNPAPQQVAQAPAPQAPKISPAPRAGGTVGKQSTTPPDNAMLKALGL